MKEEKIPKSVIKFMKKTPGGKIIDAHVETPTETTVDTTTQPIPAKTARQETKKITGPKAKPRTISNFADLGNLLEIETPVAVEPQPVAKIEPEKTPTKKSEEKKKKIEHKKPTVLERIFDSLSEESRKFISGQIGKMRTEDKNTKGVLGLQQDPVRYIREALTQSRSVPEKMLLEKIQRDLKKSLSKNQKSNPAPKAKAVSEPVVRAVEPEKIPKPEVDENPLMEPATPEVAVVAEENPQDEKEKAVAELKETISKANQRLIEIEKELAAIRARREAREKAVAKEARESEKIEKEKTVKKPESQTFSTDFIKSRIKNLLESSGKISSIEKLEVKGFGEEIFTDLTVKAKVGFIKITINIDATLGNKGNLITLKKFNVDNKLAETFLSPYLNKIPELLRDYIEKEKGKKVTSTKIKNGELEVTF